MKKLVWAMFFMAIAKGAYAQEKIPALYLTVQCGVNKFRMQKGLATGSLSVGVKINENIGVGLNSQVMKVKGNGHPFIPVSFEFSCLFSSQRLSPYATFQIGKMFYHRKDENSLSDQSILYSEANGGIYFSPNIGISIPIKEETRLLLSVGYVYTRINADSKSTSANNVFVTGSDANLKGFKLLVGIQFDLMKKL